MRQWAVATDQATNQTWLGRERLIVLAFLVLGLGLATALFVSADWTAGEPRETLPAVVVPASSAPPTRSPGSSATASAQGTPTRTHPGTGTPSGTGNQHQGAERGPHGDRVPNPDPQHG